MSKVYREWEETVDKDSKEWKDFQKELEIGEYLYSKNIQPILDLMLTGATKFDTINGEKNEQ
tara:strand:- start:1054 stop:1239 length:186 start_codon:yes stop_codon:yes gene_type:complete